MPVSNSYEPAITGKTPPYRDDLYVNGSWSSRGIEVFEVGELDAVDDVGESSFQ